MNMYLNNNRIVYSKRQKIWDTLIFTKQVRKHIYFLLSIEYLKKRLIGSIGNMILYYNWCKRYCPIFFCRLLYIIR